MNTAKSWLVLVFLVSMLPVICMPAGASAEDYVIGVGDVLSISRIIIKEGKEEKDKEIVTVRPDGKIAYPLIGEVTASGLTPMQLRMVIVDKLSEFYANPEVTVNLKQSRQDTVYIFGNFKAAGSTKLKGKTNLLQLFATIGTFPNHVDLKSSFIVRDNKKLPVDLYGLIQEGDLSQNIYLKNGDTLFFKDKPKVVEKKVEEVNKFENIIRVVGEVKQEKTFNHEEGMTILDAILKAGGVTPYARPSGTKVIRRRGDKIEEILIDIDAVRNGEVDKNILLEPGDVISVPASLF